jgi:hypothetical protein
MKDRYYRLANSAGFQEGDRVWLYHPTRTRGRSPKLQSAWEGPYKVITRINDVVYRIQRLPRSRMMVLHLDRLAPYLGQRALNKVGASYIFAFQNSTALFS